MPKRIQITITDDIACVLGVTATVDGVTEHAVMRKALVHYLSGRLRYPPIARAARALGSKMPDRVLNGSDATPRDAHSPSGVRSRDDSGSLTVFFVAVVTSIFLVIALSIDGGRMLADHGQVTFAAAAAATSAATAGATASPGNTVGAATQVLNDNGASLSSVTTTPGQVCVTASRTESTWFLGIVGISHFTANATSCAK
ncbi:MAG: hypothetical protein ACYCST_04610 [Acidimicrobiales bacterium]